MRQIYWHGRDGKGGKDKSLMTIPIVPGSDKESGENFVLKPGINDVPDDSWLVARSYQTIKDYLSEGKLEEVQLENLFTLRAPQASLIAKETIDLNLLNKWKKAEQNSFPPREDVIKAIDLQVTAMMTPGVKEAASHQEYPPEAFEWAQKNPNHPEAIKIMATRK